MVTLRCKNNAMRSVIDKFGDHIRVNIMDDEHFTAQVQVQTSQTFYGWVFTFAGEIEIMEPGSVQKEYLAMAKKASGQG
ncbi:WCX domain-containing protein [Porcincola intestinalis]|uniref:WYL domain-containing protein n=2 Tax=Porcincola intestinalis TaxID=2606632 RepID=A0A6L5X2B8_9FIRM|nr:WYL domain-containing protein [Porcincola intestinalis]MSS14360.1 WYL domain-containing protein [Porcincola intestinalis]